MTPGTRPSRRTARAAPLPARGRTVALISLTVAIVGSSFNCIEDASDEAARVPMLSGDGHAGAVLDGARSRRGQPPGVFWGRNRGLIAAAPANDKKPNPPESGIMQSTWSSAEAPAGARTAE